MKLYDVLHQRGLNNRQLRLALDKGKVRLCGVPTADGGRDVDPEDVQVIPDAPRITVGRDPYVVYCDEDLAVMYKPSGWLATPAVGRRRTDDIVSWVRRRCGEAHAVHRLDEGTSGLMMVALHTDSQWALKEQLAARSVHRQYLAIVRHNFPLELQTYDTFFVRNRGDGKRGSAPMQEGAKAAITHVRCLEHLCRDASLVEAQLETGRTHQVRVHLAEAGFAVLGDSIYGSHAVARASARLALHAWSLTFAHPADGAPCTFTAPLADDLERMRRMLQAPPVRSVARAGQRRRRA